MDSFAVLKNVVTICESLRLRYWIVGGFAYDGVRRYLSRIHGDVDVCIHAQDFDEMMIEFARGGFRLTKQGLKYVFYKNNIKIDVFVLVPEKNCYVRKREWFIAYYPKEIFDRFQYVTLDGFRFRIPSNEGIKYYGSKTVHSQDKIFTESLPVDQNLYSRIDYQEFADYKMSTENIVVEEIHLNNLNI